MLILVKADIVENEELRFRPEIGDIRYLGALHIVFRFQGDIAGIAGVVFTCDGIAYSTDHHQGLFF
ncbi:hypothetical protein ES703_101443 [subsurface metagenome]